MPASIDELIKRVTEEADPAAFDQIVASGVAAVPALVAALIKGTGAIELSAILETISRRLDDPISVLEPLATHASSNVADAAVAALGASGDVRAVPILAASPRRFASVVAL